MPGRSLLSIDEIIKCLNNERRDCRVAPRKQAGLLAMTVRKMGLSA